MDGALDGERDHKRQQRAQVAERARYLRQRGIAKGVDVVAVTLLEMGQDGIHSQKEPRCHSEHGS